MREWRAQAHAVPGSPAGARPRVPDGRGEGGWDEGSPVVEATVNDGIVHGGAHGQPEECQVHLLDELVVVDVLLEAAQDEVEVVGKPADSKRHHHQHHGLHKLGQESLRSHLSLEAASPPTSKSGGRTPLIPGKPSVSWSIHGLDP